MWKSFRSLLLLLMTFAMISCAEASRELTTTPEQDEAFSQLRDAARKNNPERDRIEKHLVNRDLIPCPFIYLYFILLSSISNILNT